MEYPHHPTRRAEMTDSAGLHPPRRVQQRPRLFGSQTALTDARSGNCDQQGRSSMVVLHHACGYPVAPELVVVT
jgi:hypothetical protein